MGGFPSQPARHAAPAPEPRRGRKLLIVTTVVALVLAISSAGLAYAFVNRLDAYHKEVGVVSQRNATISANTHQISDLKSQLQSAQSQISLLQQQAAGSANQVTELTQEKAALGKCINSINNFFTIVADGGSTTAQNTAQDQMQTDCTAAEKFLG
jgi:uncharacterized protein HemX